MSQERKKANRHYAENIVKIIDKNSMMPIYIYMGKNGYDYLMSNKCCSCKSFLFNSVFKAKSNMCYHLKYLRNAEEKDEVKTLYLNSNDFLLIIEEIFSTGKSLKLRKELLNGND